MEWVACVGVDWGEREHAFAAQALAGERIHGKFESAPDEVHEWARRIREIYPTGTIAVIVEQSRGSLIYALMAYAYVAIVPVNPRASKAYRESRRLSGASSDPLDADLLCDFGIKHQTELRVWQPDDIVTRKLRLMAEARRTLVDQRTALTHALAATLRQYFPQALQWFGGEKSSLLRALLTRWTTLHALATASTDELRQVYRSCHRRKIDAAIEALGERLRTAVPLTQDPAVIESSSMYVSALIALIDPLERHIVKYDQEIKAVWANHPDLPIFESLPGAGAVMAPRLAVAFGTDRSRYQSADEIQCYSGIAPVQEQSGQRRWVHARWGFPSFLHQTFHEFAQASIPHSAWAKAVYHEHRERGAGHHEAIRALAFKWMRILFRLWQDHTVYDEAIHLERLKAKRSPIVQRLAA